MFDGSSFGGSQVHDPPHSLHSGSRDINAYPNPQSAGVKQFNFGLDNRPYVPKATVILNQDTDFEQLDIDQY